MWPCWSRCSLDIGSMSLAGALRSHMLNTHTVCHFLPADCTSGYKTLAPSPELCLLMCHHSFHPDDNGLVQWKS